MINRAWIPDLGLAAGMTLAGFALGVGYFLMLRRTAALLIAGQGWSRPLLLTLMRVGAIVILLGTAAQMSVGSLIVTVGGFLLARSVVLLVGSRVS